MSTEATSEMIEDSISFLVKMIKQFRQQGPNKRFNVCFTPTEADQLKICLDIVQGIPALMGQAGERLSYEDELHDKFVVGSLAVLANRNADKFAQPAWAFEQADRMMEEWKKRKTSSQEQTPASPVL